MYLVQKQYKGRRDFYTVALREKRSDAVRHAKNLKGTVRIQFIKLKQWANQ